MIYNNIRILNQALPPEGRILGLDVGTKNIGLAISDQSRIIANPKAIIKRSSNSKDFAKIAQAIASHQATAIIIGLPLNMDGSESTMS